MTLSTQTDTSLRSTLQSLHLDQEFIQNQLQNKAKQYDFLPIAYNSHLVASHIRHTQQSQHLQFYQDLVKDQSNIEVKAIQLCSKIQSFKEDTDLVQESLLKVAKDATTLDKENQKYQEELRKLLGKKEIISQLYKELTLTDHEKKVLFGDDDDLEPEKVKQSADFAQQLGNVDQNEEESRFDRFKQDFFQALGKMRKMQEIQALIKKDPSQSQQLANSIQESIQFIEENAYQKLVNHLRNKIRLFDTPLENQPDFLTFMKVTLKMLKTKSQLLYGHIMNDLIRSRQRYIEVSYQEKSNLIFNTSNNAKFTGPSYQNSAKNVAVQIAWLHETLMNELQILDHTSIDQSKYIDALNSIFNRNLAKQIKQRLDKEIQNQEELLQAFELYYLLISFQQIMLDQFVTKSQITKKTDFSDFMILSFFGELKSKSLAKLIECSDAFLSKLTNLFYSQAAQSALQIERAIQLIFKIFSKLLEVIKTDKKDLEIFKKKILMYSIVRVLPNVSSLQYMVQEQAILPQNLVLLFNYFDQIFTNPAIIPKELRLFFKDELELIRERSDEIQKSLRQLALQEIENRPMYKRLSEEIQGFDDYRQTLEDFEEDLEYEEIRLSFLQGITNQENRQLIIEMIKEEVLRNLKGILEVVVEEEINLIHQKDDLNEEEKEKAEKRLNYLEFEMVEKLEYIKKKIS